MVTKRAQSVALTTLVGPSLLLMVEPTRRISPHSPLIHRISTTSTHGVDTALTDPPLRCRLVSQTPIYDQLRGERINAEVPASGADPQRVDHPGRHSLPSGGLGPAAVFGRSPGKGADAAAGWCWFAAVESVVQAEATARSRTKTAGVTPPPGWTYPAAQPAAGSQQPAAVEGPRAALPSATHARPEPAPPRSGSPAPAADRSPAVQGAAL